MDLLWRGLGPHEPSLEHLHVTPWTALEGTVVAGTDGEAYTFTYRVEVGADGHPTVLTANVTGGRTLVLRRDGEGGWQDGAGRPLPELSGCTDVDLRMTPGTNTIPIRRLNLGPDEAGTILAAWVDVPTLTLRTARQRYTRLGERTYRYENLESGDAAEIEVDADGLVTSYPGAFERLESGRPA